MTRNEEGKRQNHKQHSLTYPLAGISQFADGAQVVHAVVLHQVYQRAEVVAVLHVKVTLICLEDFKMPHPIA